MKEEEEKKRLEQESMTRAFQHVCDSYFGRFLISCCGSAGGDAGVDGDGYNGWGELKARVYGRVSRWVMAIRP